MGIIYQLVHLFVMVITFLATIFYAWGSYHIYQQAEYYEQHVVRMTGTVIRNEKIKDSRYAVLVVLYQTPEGEWLKIHKKYKPCRRRCWSRPSARRMTRYRIDKRVEVAYLPDTPEEVFIDPDDRFLNSIIVGFASLGCLFLFGLSMRSYLHARDV